MPRKKAKTSKQPSVAAEPVVGYITNTRKKGRPLKALTDEDWVRPGRPATEEEIEKMLNEAEAEFEAGLGYTAEEVMAYVKEHLAEWRKSRK